MNKEKTIEISTLAIKISNSLNVSIDKAIVYADVLNSNVKAIKNGANFGEVDCGEPLGGAYFPYKFISFDDENHTMTVEEPGNFLNKCPKVISLSKILNLHIEQ